MVCPLRVILVVISSVVAGYLLWRTISAEEEQFFEASEERAENTAISETLRSRPLHIRAYDGARWLLLLLLDMGSGRFLLRQYRAAQKENSSVAQGLSKKEQQGVQGEERLDEAMPASAAEGSLREPLLIF
eukprot:TRINITY_DN39286_c0_g1_i1.p1 TRINITY_DN39286_c0_g1~~TRINITY_DN39286_c0_g1_i1.p1  ORF type:complete len:131 (+),score=21.34 TRINITY_DN39286_c0_g1_i1:453-845(+)